MPPPTLYFIATMVVMLGIVDSFRNRQGPPRA
jgi:hypothetical protein